MGHPRWLPASPPSKEDLGEWWNDVAIMGRSAIEKLRIRTLIDLFWSDDLEARIAAGDPVAKDYQTLLWERDEHYD